MRMATLCERSLRALGAFAAILIAVRCDAAITLQFGSASAAPSGQTLVGLFASASGGESISGFNLPIDIGQAGVGFTNAISLDANPIRNAVYGTTALKSQGNALFAIDGIVNGDGANFALASAPTKLFDLAFNVSISATPQTIPIRLVNPTTPVNQFNVSGPGNPAVTSIVAGSLTIGASADADFNDDGQVDGADFLLWQRTLGTEAPDVDASGNGIVDAADLTAWRAAYGATMINAAATAVPEPSASALAILTAATLRCGARRQRLHAGRTPKQIGNPAFA